VDQLIVEQVLARRIEAAALYKEEHDVDPTPLLDLEHTSDYDSEPDDYDEESKEDWEERMAEHCGHPTSGPEFRARTYWERLGFLWRSDEVGLTLNFDISRSLCSTGYGDPRRIGRDLDQQPQQA
jgi:hypothetical protein